MAGFVGFVGALGGGAMVVLGDRRHIGTAGPFKTEWKGCQGGYVQSSNPVQLDIKAILTKIKKKRAE